MNPKRIFKSVLVLALAVFALGASTALAAKRPDDPPGPLGVGTVKRDTSDVVSRYLARRHVAVRPDDRAGIRGVGRPTKPHRIVHRSGVLRPDDRAGTRGA